jgi:hypothetical protein
MTLLYIMVNHKHFFTVFHEKICKMAKNWKMLKSYCSLLFCDKMKKNSSKRSIFCIFKNIFKKEYVQWGSLHKTWHLDSNSLNKKLITPSLSETLFEYI